MLYDGPATDRFPIGKLPERTNSDHCDGGSEYSCWVPLDKYFLDTFDSLHLIAFSITLLCFEFLPLYSSLLVPHLKFPGSIMTDFDVSTIPDLSGKVIFITGGW